jgi:hypothetical protein
MSDSTEALQTTLWSPGFQSVLGVIAEKYKTLARDATHNASATEKQHHAVIQQLGLIRALVRDIYNAASEQPPQSIIALMDIK